MALEQYQPRGFNFLPPVVKNLLILNGLFFLATYAAGIAFQIDLNKYLSLHYFKSPDFGAWQYITYMFMHDTGGLGHIFFNMFALWMFGNALENLWGAKRFLIFYLFTGIGAAFIQTCVNYYEIASIENTIATFYGDPPQVLLNVLQSRLNGITLGASGAVFGILVAFGMTFPDTLLYLYFLVPVKAKWAVIGYASLELIFGISGVQSGVAHFAHLGGALFGFLLIMYWRKHPPKY